MKINCCPKFGWSFDREHPMCKQCKRASICFSFSTQDGRKRKFGSKPRIPYARPKKRRMPPIQVSPPTIQNGKMKISLTFDLAWLREHAESEHGTESH